MIFAPWARIVTNGGFTIAKGWLQPQSLLPFRALKCIAGQTLTCMRLSLKQGGTAHDLASTHINELAMVSLTVQPAFPILPSLSGDEWAIRNVAVRVRIWGPSSQAPYAPMIRPRFAWFPSWHSAA